MVNLHIHQDPVYKSTKMKNFVLFWITHITSVATLAFANRFKSFVYTRCIVLAVVEAWIWISNFLSKSPKSWQTLFPIQAQIHSCIPQVLANTRNVVSQLVCKHAAPFDRMSRLAHNRVVLVLVDGERRQNRDCFGTERDEQRGACWDWRLQKL